MAQPFQWRDHRQVYEGIVSTLRTGLPWRDLPERFGPWQTVHGRFASWAADGTFDHLLTMARPRAEVDSLAAYQRRNVVERCFHRLEQWRGIATRQDKHPYRYLAAITLASTLIRLDT
ncbi:transposase [Streptomyces sp. NPDC101181]|uniref:transposase n=1 Tax=Streptomyces sp. NPDC101181 TaxID=3366125 RepID=UPI0037F9D05A